MSFTSDELGILIFVKIFLLLSSISMISALLVPKVWLLVFATAFVNNAHMKSANGTRPSTSESSTIYSAF
jgi:hypothetical protein